MDVWLGGLAAAIKLEKVYLDQFRLAKTGGRNQWTDHNCLPQSGYNDFEHTRQKVWVHFSDSWGRGQVIVGVSWKPESYPLHEK